MTVNQTNGNGQYAYADALVTTDWVAAHLADPSVRLVEVSVDTAAYDSGHIPGAIGWSWKQDTQDTLRRDMPDQAAVAALLSRTGITFMSHWPARGLIGPCSSGS